MVNIRVLEAKDIERCVKIANEGFKDEIEIGLPKFTQEYFTSRLTNKRVKIWIAEDENVLGFMLLTDATIEVPAILHLIAVDISKRKRGTGKQLVQQAIDYVTDNTWIKLKLSTRPWNNGMRKFCTDLGFIQEAYLTQEYPIRIFPRAA